MLSFCVKKDHMIRKKLHGDLDGKKYSSLYLWQPRKKKHSWHFDICYYLYIEIICFCFACILFSKNCASHWPFPFAVVMCSTILGWLSTRFCVRSVTVGVCSLFHSSTRTLVRCSNALMLGEEVWSVQKGWGRPLYIILLVFLNYFVWT